MKQGTIQHFCKWASELRIFDDELGDFRAVKIEPFQRRIVKDVLAGKRKVWVVIPEGNGKTTLMALVALYHLDPKGWGIKRPWVVVAAATRDQATWLYQQAASFVRDSASMRGRFLCQEGHKRIRLPEDAPDEDEDSPRGRIQIWAADDKHADGAIFTLAIIDELHNHKDLRLYRRWEGKLRKRRAQLLTISTAGEPGSEFEDARAKLLQGAAVKPYMRNETDSAVIHDYGVRDRRKLGNMRAVKAANPFSAITVDTLREKRASATMTPLHWMRFTGNIAARIEGEGIPPELWDAAAVEVVAFEPGMRVFGGWDMAWTVDCAALIVLGWASFERRVVLECRVFEPPSGGAIDEAAVVGAMVELQREYGVEAWAFDPHAGARQMVQMLEKGDHPLQEDVGFTFVEVPQSSTVMSRAAARLEEALQHGWLEHDGNRELRKHALNAVRRQVPGEMYKFDRPPEVRGGTPRRKQFPIDALTALLMAHWSAVGDAEQEAPEILVAVGA